MMLGFDEWQFLQNHCRWAEARESRLNQVNADESEEKNGKSAEAESAKQQCE